MTRLKTGEGPPCIFEGFPVEQCIVWVVINSVPNSDDLYPEVRCALRHWRVALMPSERVGRPESDVEVNMDVDFVELVPWQLWNTRWAPTTHK